MKQQNIFDPIPSEKFSSMSREDLESFAKLEQRVRIQLQQQLEKVQSEKLLLEQQSLLVDDKYIFLKKKFFGRSSEKELPLEAQDLQIQEGCKNNPKARVLLPSQRYPHLSIEVEEIELKNLPTCECCGSEAMDSGMYEVSESLTLDPREFYVRRTRRKKYRCGKCHSSIITTPMLPRITPGGS